MPEDTTLEDFISFIAAHPEFDVVLKPVLDAWKSDAKIVRDVQHGANGSVVSVGEVSADQEGVQQHTILTTRFYIPGPDAFLPGDKVTIVHKERGVTCGDCRTACVQKIDWECPNPKCSGKERGNPPQDPAPTSEVK
jgi:hypothetical protein